MDNNLDTREIRRILGEIYRQGKAARIRTYLDIITRANIDNVREALKMSNTALTFEDVLLEVSEEVGLIAKWEEHKAIEIAQNALAKGLTVDVIHDITGLDVETIKGLSAG